MGIQNTTKDCNGEREMTIEYRCKIDTPYEKKGGLCIGQEKCHVGRKFYESETICPYLEMLLSFDPYVL
jgi:hypothetical protein